MDPNLIRTLTIKKRNAINLKHIMTPQQEILAELGKMLEELYHGDLGVYFEDLEYKHDKIMSNIAIVTESTDTLSDSYNSLMTIKTNHMVSVLTIVTVII
jgi:Mg2+ and Co2+ transporter CorA